MPSELLLLLLLRLLSDGLVIFVLLARLMSTCDGRRTYTSVVWLAGLLAMSAVRGCGASSLLSNIDFYVSARRQCVDTDAPSESVSSTALRASATSLTCLESISSRLLSIEC